MNVKTLLTVVALAALTLAARGQGFGGPGFGGSGGGTTIITIVNNSYISTNGPVAIITYGNVTNDGFTISLDATNLHVATWAQGLLAGTALQPGASYSNISGLGTAATHAVGDFDAAGAAAGATNGLGSAAWKTLSFFDVAGAGTAAAGAASQSVWNAAAATFDGIGAAANVAALRASATAFGLAKAGAGLTATAGVLAVSPGAFAGSTNCNTALTWDGRQYISMDVLNTLTGPLTLTLTNLVAGVPYVGSVRTGATGRLVTLSFAMGGTVFAATGSYLSTQVPANSLMVIQFQAMADGSVVFSTTGAQ